MRPERQAVHMMLDFFGAEPAIEIKRHFPLRELYRQITTTTTKH